MGTIIRIHLQGRKALSNLRSLLFQSTYKTEKLFQTYGHCYSNPFTRQKSSFKLTVTVIPIHLQDRKALSNLRSLLFQSIYEAKKLFQTYGHCYSNPFTRQKSSFKLTVTVIPIHLRGRKALSNLRSLLFQSIYKAKKLFQNYGHYYYNPFTRQKSSVKLMDTIIIIHLQGRKALSSLWTLLF